MPKTVLAQGVRDLFWLPVEEYKKDGHIVKGIQRGAESFTLSTATAALELTQRLVGTVQVGLSPSLLTLNAIFWFLIPGMIQRCLIKVYCSEFLSLVDERCLLFVKMQILRSKCVRMFNTNSVYDNQSGFVATVVFCIL